MLPDRNGNGRRGVQPVRMRRPRNYTKNRIIGFLCSFSRGTLNWFKRSHCPKCGEWHCLQFHSEIVKDKVVGHSRTRYGNYKSWMGRSQADPFIREWVEERYICSNCGRHVSIEITRDRW